MLYGHLFTNVKQALAPVVITSLLFVKNKLE